MFRRDTDPLQTYLTIASLCFFYFSNAATLSVVFDRPMRAQAAIDLRAGRSRAGGAVLAAPRARHVIPACS